jgi:signal transduction histidine kinase/DNA-binding LacI/PurR family transcriptional regulator
MVTTKQIKRGKPNISRPRIALIAPNTWSGSSFSLALGVSDALREAGADFICYQGSYLRAPGNFYKMGNVIYDFIDKESLNGIVIWASSLSNYISYEDIHQFCLQFKPLPLISIGLSFPGIPGVFVDSYQGMYELVSHLVEGHGYNKIAFQPGPEHHAETISRYQGYLDALKQYGIQSEPDLIAPAGMWSESVGVNGIRVLLDERKVKFDALVGASDILAVGACRELKRRGYRIPEDLAVVGYNDAIEGEAVSPPLTTSKSKLYERGWVAVEMLFQIINGKVLPEQRTLPAAMVIRRSCGCPSVATLAAEVTSHKPSLLKQSHNLRTEWKKHRTAIVSEIGRSFERPVTNSLMGLLLKLSDAFVDEIVGDSHNVFSAYLEAALHQDALDGSSIVYWHWPLAAMFREISALLNPTEYAKAKYIWQEARVSIGEVAEREQKFLKFKLEESFRILNGIGQQMIGVFDYEGLAKILEKELPRLEIDNFYLAVYEDPKAPIKMSNLIMALNKNGRVSLKPKQTSYSTTQLLPPDLFPKNHYAVVVQPLFVADSQIGYIVFDVCSQNAFIYELLPIHLSNAIWSTLMFQKEKAARDAFAKQSELLARSNEDLQQFAYIASHDLQEPLRKITVFGDRLRELEKGKLAEQSLDYLERMRNAALRMQVFINDLLLYSRVTSKTQPFERLNLVEIATGVISDLEIQLTRTGGRIDLEELPILEADSVQIRQLFQNLIGNALKFHRPDQSPVVRIFANVKNETGEIIFEDNGIGISDQYHERIFGVFERLHGRDEYEGSGIGLAICKKIVERHSGSIRVENNIGQGSRFIVILPLHQNSHS